MRSLRGLRDAGGEQKIEMQEWYHTFDTCWVKSQVEVSGGGKVMVPWVFWCFYPFWHPLQRSSPTVLCPDESTHTQTHKESAVIDECFPLFPAKDLSPPGDKVCVCMCEKINDHMLSRVFAFKDILSAFQCTVQLFNTYSSTVQHIYWCSHNKLNVKTNSWQHNLFSS